jgi:glycosyltransferase involved in cell wall biosynthesis
MSMSKPSLSVVLAVHNESNCLGTCLQAIKDIADEIIVVDGHSTDNTVAIAKSYSAHVISTTNKPNFHINKNIAISAAKCDWILQLDADEVVTPALKKDIVSAINAKQYNGYWMNRKNWFLSRFLTKGGQYPDPTIRLYRRGYGKLPAADVHEQACVKGSIGHLSNDLLHYRDTSFKKYLGGFDRYSSLIALQMANNTTPNPLAYLLYKPLYTFLNIYIRHKGFVDGFPGFVFAFFSGLIFPVAYIKHFKSLK